MTTVQPPRTYGSPAPPPLGASTGMVAEPEDRLAAVWRAARVKRRQIARLALLGALVSALVSLVLPERWVATASFFPERRGTPDLTGGLSSLTGLSGLLGGAGASLALGPSATSQFFADIVKSRSFQDSLAKSRVRVDSEGTIMKVADYLVPRAKNAAMRRFRARQKLRASIRVTTQPSGVVVLAVTAKSPYAAAGIANRALVIIDALNVAFRHREAAARRAFTQTFLDDVQERLTGAEDRLEQFLATNRTFITPALTRKQQALQAEVDRLRMLQQQLESNIENARLSEYNNAPVVATVDQASVPERRSSPQRKKIVAGGLLLTLLGIFWALYLRLWV